MGTGTQASWVRSVLVHMRVRSPARSELCSSEIRGRRESLEGDRVADLAIPVHRGRPELLRISMGVGERREVGSLQGRPDTPWMRRTLFACSLLQQHTNRAAGQATIAMTIMPTKPSVGPMILQ